MTAIVGIILVVQIIFGVIVFFVLKNILEKKLLEATLQDLDLFLMKNEIGTLEKVVIVCGVELSPVKKQMVQEALQKKLSPNVQMVYERDTSLLGGMVLRLGAYTIGKSLRDRLREGGFLSG